MDRTGNRQLVLRRGDGYGACRAGDSQFRTCSGQGRLVRLRIFTDGDRGRRVDGHGFCRGAALERHRGRAVHLDAARCQAAGGHVRRSARGNNHARRPAGQRDFLRRTRSRRRHIDDRKAVFIFEHRLARCGDVFLDGLIQQRHRGSAVDIRVRRNAVAADALQDAHFRQRRHVACGPVCGFAAVGKAAQVGGGVCRHAHGAGKHGHRLLTGDRVGRVCVFAVALQDARGRAAEHRVRIPLAAVKVFVVVLRFLGQAEHPDKNGCQLAARQRAVRLEAAVCIALHDALLHPAVDRVRRPAVCRVLHERLALRGERGDRQHGKRHGRGQDGGQRLIHFHTSILLIGCLIVRPPAGGQERCAACPRSGTYYTIIPIGKQ